MDGLLNLRGFWEYRELLYFLTWRDIKVRYRQMVLVIKGRSGQQDLTRSWSSEFLIHTGQHYDYGMSRVFSEELVVHFTSFWGKALMACHSEERSDEES